MTPTTAASYFAAAQDLLDKQAPGSHGVWPRATAWLLRLSLEASLRDFWTLRLPEASDCNMRAQLLVLPRYSSPEIARDVGQTWSGLSRAGHHHAYELAPSAAELKAWSESVEQSANALGCHIRPAVPAGPPHDSVAAPSNGSQAWTAESETSCPGPV